MDMTIRENWLKKYIMPIFKDLKKANEATKTEGEVLLCSVVLNTFEQLLGDLEKVKGEEE